VLKLPDTPAVLLETAYLSNPQEEKLLKTYKFRRTIAQAVALSVDRYFSGSVAAAETRDEEPKESGEKPALKKTAKAMGAAGIAEVAGAAGAEDRMKTAAYTVRKGESLHAIALKHKTNLATLLTLNKMKLNDPLYAGRKILVPAAGKETAGKRRLKQYTVQKGDTLFLLAKSSSVTIEELRRINKMTETDVLRVGQRIHLPE
jgi:N-acetylmuramoyl-L-alanine amidase